MTPEAYRLLQALAHGKPLNGTRYAAQAGISRAAVWKQVERLRRAGLPVAAVRGAGYRLAWPIELLDADEIRRSGVPGEIGIEVRREVGSTNREMIGNFRHRHALAAEFQRSGRGRRGRGWILPPGCGVAVSYGYRFDCGLQRLGPLSLVAGVAVAEAVAENGMRVAVKWPNDLVVDDRKLGGLLLEISGAAEGPCRLVVGVGVNTRLPRSEIESADFSPPDQPWIDLHEAGAGDLDRNRLIGRIVVALDDALHEFERSGFEPFASRWQSLDVLMGRRVRVIPATGAAFEGLADGVTGQGMLRVARDGRVVELNAGEVSVRAD